MKVIRFIPWIKGIIVGDMFVVGDYEGILHMINIGDGKLVGRTYLGKNSPVVNNMMIGEDDSIIVMNEDGSILKLVISDIDIPLDESKVISEEGGDAENSTTLKLFDKLKDAILD